MPRGQCHRHGANRPCTCAMGNLYRFVEPVVLYLLARRGTAYGYDLARELETHALTDAVIDRSALYRTLQQLEANGHVESNWDVSGRGPARHTYRLTDSGRRHLAEWCVVLRNLSESMARFVDDARQVTDAASSSCGKQTGEQRL